MDAPTLPPSTLPPTTSEPVDPIEALRTQIDACDEEIIALVRRRQAISREIGSLRAAGGGTRLSLAREQQLLARFGAALGPDGAALAMLLLRQGRGSL
jgi:chorismate mutase